MDERELRVQRRAAEYLGHGLATALRNRPNESMRTILDTAEGSIELIGATYGLSSLPPDPDTEGAKEQAIQLLGQLRLHFQ